MAAERHIAKNVTINYSCSPQVVRSYLSLSTFSELCVVLWTEKGRNLHYWQIFKVHTSSGNRQDIVIARSERVNQFLENPLWHTCLRSYEEWIAILSLLFVKLQAILGMKHLTTAAFHPQTSGKIEPYNRITITQLQHYVPKNEKDWDTYVQPLMYAHNA